MNQKDYNEIARICHDLNAGMELNAFALLSKGTVQLENFHSLIISQLLNPQQRHGRAKTLMKGFFNYLERKAVSLKKCDVAEALKKAWNDGFFDNAAVAVEYPVTAEEHKGRIDILIQANGKVVIVENKINGAPDMSRQLVRYIKGMRDAHKEVLAVVYLKEADANGHPAWDGWSGEDRDMVNKLLIPMSADAEGDDLSIVRWLEEASNADGRITGFAHQYIDFLRGQMKICEDGDALCKLVCGRMREVLVKFRDDAIVLGTLSLLPEYISRRVVYSCPACEFGGKVVYGRDRAAFKEYCIRDNRSRDGNDIELALDVFDNRIDFFVRTGVNMVSPESFKKIKDLLDNIDQGFEYGPRNRNRLGQFSIRNTDAYEDPAKYVERVAKIVAGLTDMKENLRETIFEV